MKINKEVVVYFLLFFLLCVLCPHDQFAIDAKAWTDWSLYMFHHGYAQAYSYEQNPVNYNPFYLAVLNAYAHLMGSDDATRNHIYMLKFFTLLIEWLGIIYMCKALSEKADRLTNFLFCFLNIGFLYNTMIWGQIDGMLSAFIVCSFILLYRGNLILSVLLFTLALNTKLVAIFYLPLWGLLLLQHIKHISFRRMAIALSAAVALQAVFIWPFIRVGALYRVFAVNFNSVGYYKYISIGAYNFWHLIFGGKLDMAADTSSWGPLAYRQWGFLLFYLSAFFVLLPVIKDTLSLVKDKRYKTHLSHILLSGGLLCLCFFYFNTEMHERYSHPCLWFFAGYAFVSNRFVPFILSSIAVFLNMALACSEVFTLQYVLVSLIFAIAMIAAFVDLYKTQPDSHSATQIFAAK